MHACTRASPTGVGLLAWERIKSVTAPMLAVRRARPVLRRHAVVDTLNEAEKTHRLGALQAAGER